MTTAAASVMDGSVLFGFWYPAIRADQVRGVRLAKAVIGGIPLVLGRQQGSGDRVFALRDACPHRGIPLSYGHIVNGCNIECAYHGWQFEGVSGQCKLIPSLTQYDSLDAGKIYASAFPAREQDGFVWVYLPQAGTGRMSESAIAALAPPPAVQKHSPKYITAHLTAELPCNVDHGIIGLMDPAHGPFVHQSWWWRGRHSIHEKEKRFEPIPMGFRMSAHTPSTNSAPYKLLGLSGQPVTTVIDFQLPNVRTEQIRCGNLWFSSVTTVTPTTPGHTRIDVNAAWNILRGVPLVKPIAMFFGKRFVRQDQRTMAQQAEGLQYSPSLMLIDDADRPAKWYFALKRAYLESLQSGEFVHPMDGPVVLHWRS